MPTCLTPLQDEPPTSTTASAAPKFSPSTVIVAPPSMSHELVEVAARSMAERKIGCLPVIEDEGEFVGLITETDVLRYFAGLPPGA